MNTEVAAYIKSLRNREAPLRFRPTLIYLVEVGSKGLYAHPDVPGFHEGQTAWANSKLWFQFYKDAKDFVKKSPAWYKARVVKLSIAAFEENISESDDETA